MKLNFVPYLIKFKRPFSIAHGVRDSTPVVFTRLESQGVIGYGEASMPPYLGESHQSAILFLDKAKNLLQKFSNPLEVEPILTEVDKLAKGNTAAKACIDIALHDLVGKIKNESCYKLFGANNNKKLYTTYTIPIDNPEGIHNRLEEAKEYEILKVKLGSANDKGIIDEITKQTNKRIVVDVNEGWSDKIEALEMIHWLADRNVQFVEQPMPKECRVDIGWLAKHSPIPIIADEAVQRLTDVEKAAGIYSGINIKLMKCTGLNEARKMISLARKYEMKIMIGCMSETSCAISAAAQLAPLVDWIDLDGPLLIAEDYFNGVTFAQGQVILNNLPGIGVTPLPNLPNFD